MDRTVIECSECGQELSVPQKKGIVECPKCSNEIELTFAPKVVNTPRWFNKKLGFVLILMAMWIWSNIMWFRIHVFDAADIFEGLANLLCFAGVMVIALADLVRNRGRLIGEQAYPSLSINSPEDTNETSRQIIATTAPRFSHKFYVAVVVPLLMIPISVMIPDMLNWCIYPAFQTCVEVTKATYIFVIFLPFATALLLMGMSYNQAKTQQNDVYSGARISGILTLAFFFLMSFVLLTVSPY